MGKNIYIGVSGVARKVKTPNIGVSGVARKGKAGYIGVGGVARQFYEGAPPPLAQCTPQQIQQVAKSGQAPNYWNVGDKVAITLNDTVIGYTDKKGTYYVFIIGFNHNASREGNNSIHFQFGKTADGIDIAFEDISYNVSANYEAFRMNLTNTNSGGWNNSYMKNNICRAFLSAMTSDWQNIITVCPKYSDNGGSTSAYDEASVTNLAPTKIWLLSEFEVQGARTRANPAEQKYQAQYDYYKNGHSKIKYREGQIANNQKLECVWWLRSVAVYSGTFCFVTTNGTPGNGYARYSYGFAPGFMVA